MRQRLDEAGKNTFQRVKALSLNEEYSFFAKLSTPQRDKFRSWGFIPRWTPKPKSTYQSTPSTETRSTSYILSADDMIYGQLRAMAQSNILWQHHNAPMIIRSAIHMGWDVGGLRAPLDGRTIDEAYRRKTGRHPYYPPR